MLINVFIYFQVRNNEGSMFRGEGIVLIINYIKDGTPHWYKYGISGYNKLRDRQLAYLMV